MQKFEDSLFERMRGKKVIKQEPLVQPTMPGPVPTMADPLPTMAKENRIQKLIDKISPVRKKSTFDIAVDQIKYPAINKTNAVINGMALIVFCAGSFILYSELPGRIDLVIGILLVSVAVNIIVSSR
jgi:hypothetical protein